jgi:ABC-type multidrug transport system ATPase subunit
MDDPISALDSKVKKKIFKRVFKTMLKGKTQILATNAIDFMHLADHVIVLKEGRVAVQGTPDEVGETTIVKEILAVHNKNEESKKEAFKEKSKREEAKKVVHKKGCSSGSSNSETDEDLDLATVPAMGMGKMMSKSLEMTAEKTASKLDKFKGHNQHDSSDCDHSSCDEQMLTKDASLKCESGHDHTPSYNFN